MTDGQFTLLFLIVFTIFEGLFRFPLGTWIFQRSVVLFGRQLLPYFRAKNLGVGVTFPFSSAPLLCQSWPLIPTEEGVRVVTSDGSAPVSVSWDSLKPQVEGSTLILHKHATCAMLNEAMAQLWKKRLLEWQPLTVSQRETAFQKVADTSLEVQQAKKQHRKIQEMTESMQWNSRLMSLVLFLYLPLTYYFEGDGWKAFAGVGVLYGLMILQACFLRRFLKQHPVDRAQRFSRFIGCLLFPPTAIRLPDWAAVQMAGEVHPLAAHVAWSSRTKAMAVARHLHREASWPMGAKSGAAWQGPDVLAIQRFMEQHQIPLQEERKVSRELDQTKQCPRCLTAYYSHASVCKDCGGTPLQDIGSVES